MSKNLFLIIGFLCSFVISSQSINDYQFALVPARFSIFNNDDYYRLNIVTKMYLNKCGFEAFLTTDNQPEAFLKESCNKVYVDIEKDNGMFMTKVKVILKDCYGKVLAVSEEGKSREKDYVVAYDQALREALTNFSALNNHKYNGKQMSNVQHVETKTKIEVSQPVIELNSSTTLELFAKPYQNGYQLLTNTTAIPNLVLTIQKTSSTDCFLAEQNEKKGVLIRKPDGFYFDYYENGKLVSQKYTIVNF